MAKIAVAVQRWEGDTADAENLLRLMAKIATMKGGQDVLVVDFYRADAPPLSRDVKKLCEQAFTRFRSEASSARDRGWPTGCNSLWHNLMMRASSWRREAFTHILTLEGDVTVLDVDWLEKLEAELIDEKGIGWFNHGDGDYPHHNGNAAWPRHLTTKMVPEAYGTPHANSGWDVYWYPRFRHFMRDTNLIFADTRRDTASRDQLIEWKELGHVLVHGIKDDSKWILPETFFKKSIEVSITE